MKKLFLFLFALMLISSISAFDLGIDNVKQYNPISKTVTIIDKGLPLIGTDTQLATVKLNTPQHLMVEAGDDKEVAEFEINNLDAAYSKPIAGIDFYNIKEQNKKESRSFTYKWKEQTGTKKVADYVNVCSSTKAKNGTLIGDCHKVESGSHEEPIYTFHSYDSNSILPKGIITIGIFTDVIAGEHVEYVPTLFGEAITEWADFQGFTLFERFTGDNNRINQFSNSTFLAQIFTVGVTGLNTTFPLAGVSVLLNGSDFQAVDMNVTLYNATADLATPGAFLTSNATVNISTVSGFTWFNVTFPGTAITLAPGKSYELVIRSSTSAANWALNNTNGSTLNQQAESNDIGVTWVNETTHTMMYQIFGGAPQGDLTASVSLLNPSNGFSSTSTNITFNSSALIISPGNGNFTNATLFIWYGGNDTIFNQTTNIVLGNNTNSTIFTVTNIPLGNFKWNVGWNVGNTTTNLVNYAILNFTFTLAPSSTTSNAFNTTTYETALESFTSSILIGSGLVINTANLFYKGTSYPASFTNSTDTNYTLTRSGIDVPIGIGNNTWFWNIIYTDGSTENLTLTNQSVSLLNFSVCGSAPQNIPYINFTFKNETTGEESITATIASTSQYWLGSGNINKSLIFNNGSPNPSYAFCNRPQNRTVFVSPSITYNNPFSQQRTYNPGTLTLTNDTTSTTLFLLPTGLGQFVTFQVINPAQQAIAGATVSISANPFGAIESKTTDSAGGATFFLNPFTSYTVVASAPGFSSSTSTIVPSQTQFTITLGVPQNNNTDCTTGIITRTQPSVTELFNNTFYNFNFTINSTFFNLESFGFILTNGSDNLFTTTSNNPRGGFLSTNLNTDNNSIIVMDYFWVTNCTVSNATRSWNVFNTADTQWSINYFFNDLNLYITSTTSLFGLDRFGLNILIYLLIFTITGVMSYKFALNSPSAITLIVLTLVMFFDVGLNLISRPLNLQSNSLAIVHFPTFFVALVLVGLYLNEVAR